jgi:hypothetical protein
MDRKSAANAKHQESPKGTLNSPSTGELSMARAPLKLHLKKNQLHKDVGKPSGAKITTTDIAKEKAKGGVFAKRAQFAANAKKWKHAK